ncbi:Histamine H2 receptor [Holothuria leucospilota]|uniref:Histamine H2 receptor n=1 Tax=Holothuria leucospilota TaxID=206669 RepID=A0A9Q1BPY6_HOLLE|nr:Histamine H2 receptor [Holothuria leucospilota]
MHNISTTQIISPTPSPEADQPPSTVLRSVLVTIILVMIILTTVIGNTLVCLSPLVSHRLRTATYTFLVSLAVADLLLGITVLPFSAISAITRAWPLSKIVCNLYVSCDVMFCTSSILHLLVISFDRHYAITRPYAYQRKMNRKMALICIAIVWIISILISFLPIHLEWNKDEKQEEGSCKFDPSLLFSLLDGILLFFVPMMVMFVLYGRIVCIARRQAKAIRRLMVNSSEAEDGARERTNRRSVDEHKATKIIAIVLGCFVICWVPYFSVFTFAKTQTRFQVSEPVYNVILWLGYVNSLVNPLVYTAMIRDFRNAFKRILSLCFCDQNGKRCHWFGKNSAKNNFSTTYAHNSTHPETLNGEQSCNRKLQFSLKPNGFYSKILRMSTSTVQVESQGV